MKSSTPRSGVVTGVGAGIGRATARCLGSRGWAVVGIERDAGLARSATSLGDVRACIHGDVRDPQVLREARDAAVRLGPLLGWVNNAGELDRARYTEFDSEHVRRVLETNVVAVANGISVCAEYFLGNSIPGSIVNVGSVHGRLGFAGHGAYDASKAAVEALARTAAAELGPRGIRCNTVAPGAVMTEREVAARSRETPTVEPIPIPMFSRPEQIAEVIAFLLSPRSSAVNGAVVPADSGLSTVFVDGGWGQDEADGRQARPPVFADSDSTWETE